MDSTNHRLLSGFFVCFLFFVASCTAQSGTGTGAKETESTSRTVSFSCPPVAEIKLKEPSFEDIECSCGEDFCLPCGRFYTYIHEAVAKSSDGTVSIEMQGTGTSGGKVKNPVPEALAAILYDKGRIICHYQVKELGEDPSFLVVISGGSEKISGCKLVGGTVKDFLCEGKNCSLKDCKVSEGT